MNNLSKLQELRERYKLLCQIIDPRMEIHDFPTERNDTGYPPHVEITDDTYYWVWTERGSEVERWKTKDIDEMLFWLVDLVVGGIANSIALEKDGSLTKSSDTMQNKHIEIMSKVNPEWGERVSNEYEKHNKYIKKIEAHKSKST